MEIKILESSFKEKYTSICAAQGTVFSTLKWLDIYDDALTVYGIFNNDNKLIGGFHVYKTKMAGMITHLKNPPFTPHIGLFYENQSGTKANALSFEKTISNCLAEFFNQLPYQIFTVALPSNCTDTQSFIWTKFKVVPNYSYHLDLTLSEADLLKNLASDKRNSINKAEKDKVTVSLCSDRNVVKQMVENTYSRKAKSLNENIVNKILFQFSSAENSFGYSASVNNTISALSYCIHDQHSAYYLLGGYDNQNKHQGAGVLALWNCILHAKKLGLKKFDFEGSMIPQVEKYFRGFGGDLVPYYTLNKANIVLETALKFVKRESF